MHRCFYRLATGRVGGSSVPVLIVEGKAFTDSTEILKYLDTIAPDEAKLYPSQPALLKSIEELETLFNTQLGTASRLWAYSYTLHHPKLAQRRFLYKVPFHEQVVFPLLYPLVNALIRRKLNVTSETAIQAHEQIRQIFDISSIKFRIELDSLGKISECSLMTTNGHDAYPREIPSSDSFR